MQRTSGIYIYIYIYTVYDYIVCIYKSIYMYICRIFSYFRRRDWIGGGSRRRIFASDCECKIPEEVRFLPTDPLHPISATCVYILLFPLFQPHRLQFKNSCCSHITSGSRFFIYAGEILTHKLVRNTCHVTIPKNVMISDISIQILRNY